MNTFSVKIFGLVLVFLLPVFCLAQGTLRTTFDGSPIQPVNSQFLIQQYSESGMYFEPLPGSDGFLRNNNAGGAPAYPVDGSTYLQAGFGEGLEFGFSNGSLFGLAAVDLAAYGVNQADYTVDFIGYRSDGSTISTSFSGTGIHFQTYSFSSDWSSGLTEVVIPDAPWSMDNLAVIVPEPGSAEMFALGAVVISLRRSRRK